MQLKPINQNINSFNTLNKTNYAIETRALINSLNSLNALQKLRFFPEKTTWLNKKTRYLQLAFNHDLLTAKNVLSKINASERILIEAGTPFIKRYGFNGIRQLSLLWQGIVVADLKTIDGAVQEVRMAKQAGARAATVAGSASTETIDLFISECEKLGVISMIDMISVEKPMKVLVKLKKPPKVVVLHKGRDEENTHGKVIQYKQVAKIKSKYDVMISAAGGVDLKESRSAIFNGANIVVVNIVKPSDPWTGISTESNVSKVAENFLKAIK